MKKMFALVAMIIATVGVVASQSQVYFTKEISPESLLKIYKAVGREAKGRVAVKISTGEAGGHNYLKPDFIRNLVEDVNGVIVECNTAYPGKRTTTKMLGDKWCFKIPHILLRTTVNVIKQSRPLRGA